MEEQDDILAKAFNAWQNDYLNNPEKFEHQATTIQRFLVERADGGEPSYGEWQLATLKSYVEEVKSA